MQFLDTSELKNENIFLSLTKISPGNGAIGCVPAYFFDICEVATRKTVGQCTLRVGNNENLFYGGNLGYNILPDFRGRHYAAQACELLFRLARKHGMDKVCITCGPENKASQATCELSGAQFVQIVDLPAHNDMYLRGERQVCRYEYDLKNCNIRLATAKDLDEVSALYDSLNLHLETNVNYAGWAIGRYPTMQTAQDALSENSLYVYEENLQILGTVILNSQQPESYRDASWSEDIPAKQVLSVHTLAVHPKFLYRKIGEELLLFAEECAKRQNMLCIRLDTLLRNLPAARLYRRLGYKEAGVIDLRLGISGLTEFLCFEKFLQPNQHLFKKG